MIHSEIELKLRVPDKASLVASLERLGARFVERKRQVDTLFESPIVDFAEHDQALRLRIETTTDEASAQLTFKGTPTHTTDGHRSRDEFETPIEPEATLKILKALGFNPGLVIQKNRESYEYGGVHIEIDELPFGTFLEIEGSSAEIEEIRSKLSLQDAEPVCEGYGDLQKVWNQKNGIPDLPA